MKSKYIGIDFDGTIVKHKFPEIGEPIDDALKTIRLLQHAGHKIILYTMRSRETLVEAVKYLEDFGIQLYGVNENKTQKYWTDSPKVYCHLYIDDAALGCPLIHPASGDRPYVDWSLVVDELLAKNYL